MTDADHSASDRRSDHAGVARHDAGDKLGGDARRAGEAAPELMSSWCVETIAMRCQASCTPSFRALAPALALLCCMLPVPASAQTRTLKPTAEQRAALDAQLGSAALSGDLRLFEKMLRAGADLDAHDPIDRTVLMLALTEYEAVPGTERVPAAAEAERQRQARKLQIAAILIRRGADVTRQSALGMTALHYAVLLPVDESAALELVRMLIRKKVPLDARMGEGVTALRMAVDRGRVRIARSLVDAGADPGAADERGITPLSRALEIGPSELQRRLGAPKAGARSAAK